MKTKMLPKMFIANAFKETEPVIKNPLKNSFIVLNGTILPVLQKCSFTAEKLILPRFSNPLLPKPPSNSTQYTTSKKYIIPAAKSRRRNALFFTASPRLLEYMHKNRGYDNLGFVVSASTYLPGPLPAKYCGHKRA